MVEIAPFKPEHLLALRLQAMQSAAQDQMTVEHGRQIDACFGEAHTVMVDGKPIACGGLIQIWAGRAYVWSYLSDEALKHMRFIHRAALAGLARARWARIEMAVDVGHAAAKRWAVHLGFELEGVARKWTQDGRDVEIWARVTP